MAAGFGNKRSSLRFSKKSPHRWVVFFRRIPQIGDDVDALAVHYGDAGILGFVNVVDVDGFVH